MYNFCVIVKLFSFFFIFSSSFYWYLWHFTVTFSLTRVFQFKVFEVWWRTLNCKIVWFLFYFNSPSFIYYFIFSSREKTLTLCAAIVCNLKRKKGWTHHLQLKFIIVIRAYCALVPSENKNTIWEFQLICCDRPFDDDEGIARVAKYRIDVIFWINGSLKRWMTVVKSIRAHIFNVWFNVFLTDIHYRSHAHTKNLD